MKRSIVETVWGGAVIAVAVAFVVYVYSIVGAGQMDDSYSVEARFTAVDGIDVGSDVRIGGVKVGTVAEQILDTETYEAILTLDLNNTVKLPKDSEARITSGTLIGGAYIQLVPGSDTAVLKNGDAIAKTKDVVALEELLGKLIFLVTDGEE